MHGLVLDYVEECGGLTFFEERAKRRANDIYSIIDNSSGFYYSQVVEKSHRSRMNIPLTIGNGPTRRKDLEQKFVEESTSQNMVQLFGHPVSGGLRVTLYNGVSDDSVAHLVDFMKKFMHENSL